jgi:hypothetical protein
MNMSRSLLPWSLLFLAFPASLFAAEPFEGTWRIDLGRVELPTKVTRIELNKGMYSCSTCVPAINIKADGTDQKVTGADTFDAMSVKVIDGQNVESTYKKAGRTVEVAKITVSADGNHITERFTEYPENSSKPVTGDITLMRVEKGSAGSHATSGGWRDEKVGAISDNGLTFTYKAVPDGLSMSDQTGESYTAKFDGKDYPVKGDPGSDMVSLKRIDANTFEETFKKNGKVVSVNHFAFAADGKTGNVTGENKVQGTTIKYAIVKK